MRNDRLKVRFGEGGTNQGAVTNKRAHWGSLVRQLSAPERTRESMATYLSLRQDEKAKLKARPGWITAASYKGRRRRRKDILGFGLVTFDCDKAGPELLAALTDPSSGHPFTAHEFFLHTTRSHTPEQPRFRVIVPLPEVIPPEDYGPIVRYLAQEIDPEMEAVDHVSFRGAQLMYRPSCSADAEFVAHRNPGFLLDPVEFLADKNRDWLALPRGAGERSTHQAAEKAEDPLEKQNLIGDFCRAFPVEEAIAEFLPEVYAQADYSAGDNPRYTYLKGTAAGGAVVYEDGRFLYSWHASDPAGEQLVNAFDLVRLHKFGDLDDDDYRDAPDPTTLKSYKAMIEFAGADERVRAEALERQLGVLDLLDVVDDEDAAPEISDGTEDEDEDEDDETAAPEDDHRQYLNGHAILPPLQRDRPVRRKPPKNWREKFLSTKLDGSPRKTIQNYQRILTYDERLHDRLVWDEIREQPAIRFPIKVGGATNDDLTSVRVPNPHPRRLMSPLEEHDILNLRTLLTHEATTGGYGFDKIPTDEFRQALGLACAANPVNPVRDWCDSLRGRWDGRERQPTMIARHLHETQDAYTAAVGVLFMTGLVTRIYEPGSKWDFMPIIEGEQGIGKSTYLRALVGSEWCGDLTHGFEDTNKFVEQTRGKVVVEIGELAAMKAERIERVKEMITVQIDRTRLAYGLAAKEYLRTVILVGTTNKGTYLIDPTGNRRFWPLRVPKGLGMKLDHSIVRAERAQLWAEAVHRYDALRRKYPNRRDLPLYLTGEAERLWARRVKGVEVDDIRAERVALLEHWLNAPVPLSLLDGAGFPEPGESLVIRVKTCASEAMERALPKASDRDYTAIGRTLSELSGWVKAEGGLRIGGIPRRNVYVRADATRRELYQGYRVVGTYKGEDEPEDDLL